MSTVIFKTGADSFFWGPTVYSRGTYASYAGMNRDTKSFTFQEKYVCVCAYERERESCVCEGGGGRVRG